jgi:TIGR00255 family protein
MIQSMTGFGKVTVELPSKKITIELKSLNSRQLDLSSRISPVYREKEMQIRNEILQALERGKIEIAIYMEIADKESSAKINLPVLESYYEQIKTISENLQIPIPCDWFQTLLRMPDVIKNNMAETDESEWKEIQTAIRKAIQQLINFRQQEGSMLQKLFEQKIANIADLLKQIEPYENERIDKLKSRITENLKKIADVDFDSGRLEQELFYYIEKIDINEEKTRLSNHLNYFIDTINNECGQGKKLGFIAQEIGREINTLGSKSNHIEIQKIVVQMKDELEQIKEQVLNVL